MIKGNVMYHNVDYVEKTPLGDRFFRYPKEILEKCNTRAQIMARYSCNTELRFVMDSDEAFVRISSFAGDGGIVVYFGDFCVGQHKISAGETKCISISKPPMLRAKLEDEFYKGCVFNPNVIRLHFHGFMAIVGEIDAIGGSVRPPLAEELPSKTMLTYGSSITHGGSAIATNLCYAQTAARHLRADIINKGVAASCHGEGVIADWLSEKTDWDFAYAEIGINMIDSFSIEEFEKRYTYFIDKLSATGKPVFAPSVYMYSDAFNPASPYKEVYEKYNLAIKNYHKTHSRPNLHFIDGKEILPEARWLSADGLHPSTEGHAVMGLNVAKFIEKYI